MILATRRETTPLLAMYTLGHTFVPPAIHSGGLRYHGMAPLISHLVREKFMEAKAYTRSKYSNPPCYSVGQKGSFPRLNLRMPFGRPLMKRRKRKQKGSAGDSVQFKRSRTFDMGSYDAFL